MNRYEDIYRTNMRYDRRFNTGMGLAPYEVGSYEPRRASSPASIAYGVAVVGMLAVLGWAILHSIGG